MKFEQMTLLVWSLGLFFGGTLLNIFYITVLYHRGLAHSAVQLNRISLWLVSKTGIWVTGIDPKAWVCMHRNHHMYSDTTQDPHSPVRFGVLGVAVGQLRSYETTLRGLLRKSPKLTTLVSDLKFEVSALNRRKLWLAPIFLHLTIAVGLGLLLGSWWPGLAYYFGIMSHPVHGWMVNALAHRYGYRNFETKDQSTNNTLVSLLVFGEGLQNNHHARPKSANFAKKAGEVDMGYWLCILASKFNLLSMKNSAAGRETAETVVATTC